MTKDNHAELWEYLEEINQMAKDNDRERADARPAERKPAWGSVDNINLPKCREQKHLGEYPKRRSDDEY